MLPLALLGLFATTYSQHLHQQEVDREITSGLNYIISELDSRLSFERDTIKALAKSPAVQNYIPVLQAAERGEFHPEFRERTEKLNLALEEYQSVLPSTGSIRVLDAWGNSLAKVSFGQRTRTVYDGIDPYPLVEEDLDDEEFANTLSSLPEGEVNYVLVPESRHDFRGFGLAPMLEAVVTLDGSGYLVVNETGAPVDRVLELTPRLKKGRLFVAELNPDNPERDGMLLFDDAQHMVVSRAKQSNNKLDAIFNGQLRGSLNKQPFGAVNMSEKNVRVYYAEYLPYPNQLISWVIGTEVDRSEITSPFKRIRIGMGLFVATAFLLSLLLARFAAKRMSQPIKQLTHRIKAYALGRRETVMTTATTNEVRALNQAFDDMADRLEATEAERSKAEEKLVQSKKLASIGEMAAGIGHEINNPLNNILSLAKLIKQDLPTQQQETLSDIDSLTDETRRASRIVAGVLDFARQVPLNYSNFDARAWLQDSCRLTTQQAAQHGVKIELETQQGLRIEGDRNQLQQVMINLLINAIQASKNGSRIVIRAKTNEQHDVIIDVIDEGYGITDDAQDKLFDPFFTTKGPGQGSGLGLSVSLGIVEQHGGHIMLQNNPTRGTTATIVLPRNSAAV